MQVKLPIMRLLLIVVALLAVYSAVAQRPIGNASDDRLNQLGNMNGLNQNQLQYGNPAGVEDNNAPDQPADTTKNPPKIRKPLESYFFNDSLRAQPNFAWSLVPGTNEVRVGQIDTAINGLQNDYPFLNDGGVGAAYLGYLGAASIPLDYFKRPAYSNFSFIQGFDSYLITPERAVFYNVKKPYTHLGYNMSGATQRLEENFTGIHAQNVSPSTGFNITYHSLGTRGMYTNQKSRDKNLSLAFSHTGKKYTVHAGYIYNMANVKENGGLLRETDITDTVYEKPELLEFRLADARNELKNNTFYLTQSYGIPLRRLTDEDFSIADQSSVFIGHYFEYNRLYKKYTDTKEGSGDFYKNWFINPTMTNDSIAEGLLRNRVFIQLQPWDRYGVVGLINAGIGNDMHTYYQFKLDDYLTGNNSRAKRTSTYIYGSVEGQIKRYFSWSANATFHPFGYRTGDLSFGGKAALRLFWQDLPVTLTGNLNYDLRTPGYWTENFFSNHFAWNNSFKKETETRISVTFTAPQIGLELGGYQSVNTDKIYYDARMLPTQSSDVVSVTGLYAKKDFRAGGLHLNHRVLLQFSTAQEVIPVPLASIYLSYYFEFNVVKNVLRAQIGIDGRYNTKYYAFGYNPATAQFYNQREKELGAYPFLDAFIAAKWKRMRILAKFQHVNEDLFGERNYFTVLHYPHNKRMFKLGFSWSFYD